MPGTRTPKKPEEERASNPASESGLPATVAPTAGEVEETRRTSTALQEANTTAMQSFMTWCTARADTTDEDQFDIMASVIGEIMRSENVAQLMEERAPLHARDLIGKPLILHGFEIREGKYEESQIGFYAALTCGRAGTDETRIVTCGGLKVMAKLMMLEHFINRDDTDDAWPLVFWFTEKTTGKGYGVLDIARPEIVQS